MHEIFFVRARNSCSLRLANPRIFFTFFTYFIANLNPSEWIIELGVRNLELRTCSCIWMRSTWCRSLFNFFLHPARILFLSLIFLYCPMGLGSIPLFGPVCLGVSVFHSYFDFLQNDKRNLDWWSFSLICMDSVVCVFEKLGSDCHLFLFEGWE